MKRSIGPFSVQPIGLGCMNLDHAYGPSVSEEQGRVLLQQAVDAGYDFFDTATLYGGGLNEERLGRFIQPFRRQIRLASKCGMAIIEVDGKRQRVIDGRPETLKRECENSLRRLRTDVIDLYYLHRWDKSVPIEDSVGALADLVQRGWIRSIGLSEVSAPTLRKAHSVYPIAALQTEYSLWSRNAEVAVLQACQELNVAFVAFSPLGRGSLCGPIDPDQLNSGDIRRQMPRFKPDVWPHNAKQLANYHTLARQHGLSPAQLALLWVLKQRPHLTVIPGTTQVSHAIENMEALNKEVPDSLLQALSALFVPGFVRGPRYDAQASSEVDTEPMLQNE